MKRNFYAPRLFANIFLCESLRPLRLCDEVFLILCPSADAWSRWLISRVEFHLSVPEGFAMGAFKENLIGGAAVDGDVARSEAASALWATESAQFANEDDESKT
jgi:hypothetical protein